VTARKVLLAPDRTIRGRMAPRAGLEPATSWLTDEGRQRAGPPPFCAPLPDRALRLDFSPLPARTEQDSRRARGL